MTSFTEGALVAPVVIGIGGTPRPGSSTERSLRLALDAAELAGAETGLFGGEFLAGLPLYAPGSPVLTEEAAELVEAVRRSDGLIIASPGYHGGVSGLVKNALDYLEELRGDERPYLEQRAVGCVVTASGWQACGTTLAAMRDIAHALRGWPTPLGATVNTTEPLFDSAGALVNDKAAHQLTLVGRQVAEFALRAPGLRAGPGAPAALPRLAS